MKRLVLIQRRLTHYRVPFFEELRRTLAGRGVELTLGCGRGTETEETKNDVGYLEWAVPLNTLYLSGGRLCIQPFGELVNRADMLVVTAENKLINNIQFQFGHPNLRVALWGHGANLQGDSMSIREWFKRKMARRADWWFGYTEMSRSFISKSGFPNERVTILNNSVDTSEMQRHLESLPAGDRSAWRRENGVGDGPVGIFLGSLYAEKRLDFLLQSALAVRQVVPHFELVLVGAGPQKSLVERFCVDRPWVHYFGARSGLEKVRALAAADVMLNPGLVGLGILDSLVCGLPMVTTDCGLHSPEVAYLSHGVNGLMTDNDSRSYVSAVVSLLERPQERGQFSLECKSSGKRYSISEMARNFADGVNGCLESPVWRGRH